MNNITTYLNEFREKADEWFEDFDFIEENYTFFKKFFEKQYLQDLNWERIQEIGNHIHSFNSMPIAKSNALGNPNHPIEFYKDSFMYLAHGDDPIEERIRNFSNNSQYKLKHFGKSALSEIFGNIFADKYVFLNDRDEFALQLLGIEIDIARGDTFADKFLKYNTAIHAITDKYEAIIGKKTNFPINLEIDQFFSYLYEKYRKTDSESFYQYLIRFLEQTKTDSQSTKGLYPRTFEGLKVKVSFGQGALAKVPWISFLINKQTTQKGIYPAYLYYKEEKILILAYGISETNQPELVWSMTGELIKDYFQREYSKKPYRYGESMIYKAYRVIDINELKEDEINADLTDIINEYGSIFNKKPVIHDMPAAYTLSSATEDSTVNTESSIYIDSFVKDMDSSGLVFSKQLLSRFIASLASKPFVILTGLSGSGKTKLAQAFVKWICQSDAQYCIVPVGSDWTSREPLLGYRNALKPEEYVKPDNGVLDIIIEANNNQNLPYFIILDEMNLSHVERYFADFLSVMESEEMIPLFSEGSVENGVPQRIGFPSNLFVIGTVNVDETTYMFSPKVLDRANTIEFRVTKDEIEEFFKNNHKIEMEKLVAKGASLAKTFLEIASNKDFNDVDFSEAAKVFVSFFKQLKKGGSEFGFRSATAIYRLINQLSIIDPSLSENEKIDIAIIQKLLPKLHGSRRKLCPILTTLGSFCVTENISNVEKDVFDLEEFDFNSSENVKYPLSLEKITRMYKGAINNGFASFAEA